MSDVRRLGDRYQVGELLGRGGMAEVHEGRDLRLGRRVAIKILKPELARDPSFLARFRREAQSAASLNHPNVVAVYDTGEDVLGEGPTAETVPFIVMELVEGITLKELLSSGNKLVPERALEITSGILAALDYSHRHGIVHRDIKPGNVMLTTTGAVKVMDFGIARATADAGPDRDQHLDRPGHGRLPVPGAGPGPERGLPQRPVLGRGRAVRAAHPAPPVRGRRPGGGGLRPRQRATPGAQHRWTPRCPPQLDPIVARALAKDPAQRYQTAVEFRADVERAIAGVPVTRVMPVPPVVGPDSQATSVIGGVDPYATAAMAATGAAATGAMSPVIPGGAGDPYAAPDPMTTTAAGRPAPQGWGAQGPGHRRPGHRPDRRGRLARAEAAGLHHPGDRRGAPARGAHRRPGRGRAARRRACGSVVRSSRSPTCPRTPSSARIPRTGELVEVGSLVDVVVSAGKEQVQVPDLIDFSSESDARRALADAGLTLGKVNEEDSDQPEGTVLRQDPEPYETVDAGSAVDIWVSNAQVEVPNVVGPHRGPGPHGPVQPGLRGRLRPRGGDHGVRAGHGRGADPRGRRERQEGLAGDPDPGQGARADADPDPDARACPADGGGADGTGGDGHAPTATRACRHRRRRRPANPGRRRRRAAGQPRRPAGGPAA